MATSQDKIIVQLESNIERHNLEIFDLKVLKGEVKVLKAMIKDAKIGDN